MTAENDGTGTTPEGDDPFGYLYRQEGGDGAPAPQGGAPRRSFNQVRAVGERQYGGYGGQYGGQYGGGPGTQQTAPYGQQQPNAHYAAPETMPGGRAATQQHAAVNGGGGHGGYGAGRSRNGLLIGALAVVAAVVVGIGAAIYFNSGGKDEAQNAGAASAGADDGGKDQQQPDGQVRKGKQIGKKQDAASFQLAGGAAAASDVPGAVGRDGSYVGSMNATGASATWTADNVPKPGVYTLYVRYGVPGKDANGTLTVNGRARSQPLNMSNFAQAEEGDWEKGWTRTYAYVDLKKGTNTFKISCEDGNNCDFNLDQVWLKAGKIR
ncbi:hypothetical protein HCC61_15995 [Streptomyces sp. HNM0575]|uniref:hypothetical protein n=1 Tax=Streptomyces sp. HNM0575 TaxID=2716338 RepID=UPI00145C4485|nr:hypothetical protein [Streptomyces sp. HNM0575]NLU74164.1 hypothetical protein [Streptomyces sp. HNM0575]